MGLAEELKGHEWCKLLVLTRSAIILCSLEEEVTVATSFKDSEDDIRVPLEVTYRYKLEVCD